ncbi:MAG: HAMP domain-containing histidine kinase [Muribaculaceae bacterium]|nr:HAMP domain-containing histidine kinase [Muribaculaceae bacterium]
MPKLRNKSHMMKVAIEHILSGGRRLLLTVILITWWSVSPGMNPADSLSQVLATLTSSADSVPVMFDLVDCTHFAKRRGMLENVYHTAKRAGNHEAMLGAMFQLASFYEGEKQMEPVLLEMLKGVPESDARKRMKLYIKLRFASYEIRDLAESERKMKLLDALAKYKENTKLTMYERIEYLFYLCAYLRNVADGELLIKYLRELRGLIEGLPPDELPLRALFYTEAAMNFFKNNLYEEAIRANKKMLDVNRRFDKLHESQGRKFRNYDGTTYRCYHNILMCYDVLSDEEVEMYYNRMNDIVANNDRLTSNANLRRQSHIIYLMAKKRFREAIPLILTQLEDKNNADTYSYFVNVLIKAAREAGDKKNLRHALRIRNTLLRERLEANSDLRLQELQTIYEVNRLQEKNRKLANENHRIDLEHKRRLVEWIVVVAILLAGCLIWLLAMYARTRRLAKKLNDAQLRLIEERNSLLSTHSELIEARDKAKASEKVKNDYVNNMSNELRVPLSAIVEYSHLISDFAAEDDRAYINDYADKLDLNTDLLLTLINDVLDLPSMENGKLSTRISSVPVQEMCRFTLDLAAKHLRPGVELVFLNDGQPDIKIATDPNKVEQILLHLLINAAKFTFEGVITFGYELAPDRTRITFTVTDTGIGIPRGQEDAIFGRFKKVDSTTQGNGLGLYIGRLLAGLLKGRLTLDKEYRQGARFVLSIPLKPKTV